MELFSVLILSSILIIVIVSFFSFMYLTKSDLVSGASDLESL